MAALTDTEIAQSVIAAHGAIHLLTMALVKKEAIADEDALAVMELLAMGNSKTKETTAEAIEKLKKLIALQSKGA